MIKMKNYVVTKENCLFDVRFFGLDSLYEPYTQKHIGYDESTKEYYIEFYYGGGFNGINYEENSYSWEPLGEVEEFDTLDEVREKYILSKEPEDLPFDIDEPGYLDFIIVTRKEN